MTPRERKDMPWILAGLGFTALMIIGGIIFGWT
jgi:hypothetical protein